MFRYEDNLAKEIVLLDFQGTRMNCPAYDVVFISFSSTLPEIQGEGLANWLKMYHDQLCSDLKAFGYDSDLIYPFDQFKKDFDDIYGFGFVHALFNSMNFLKVPDLQKIRMELTSEELKEIYQGNGNTTYQNFITGLIHEAMSTIFF